MAARAHALAALAAVSLGAGGCDWRDFDDLKAHTPVLSVGPPGEFPKGDFGRYVLPLSGPPAGLKGGSFLVSAASTGCVSPVDVDVTGRASARSVCSAVFGTENVVFPNTAMAQVPGTRQVLLGAPQAEGTGAVYVIDLAKDNQVTRFDSPADGDRHGLGVGAGTLAGGAAPDFVVASESQLTVYVDGDATKAVPAPDASATCPLEIPTGSLVMARRLNRAVIVAPLTGGTASQIVVGTPAASPGMGAVSVFDVDPATGEATCAFAFRGAEERFGHALATGDFDGDGTLDLLVGAPPGKAYWIKGPLAMGAPLLPVALAGAGSDLGSSVGAANVDGKPGDEALVGDPAATVNGQAGAGEVRIVASTMPSAGMTLDRELPVLRRHEPAANDAFGAQVRALPFCTAGCGTAAATTRPLVVVGAQAHSYVYFLLLPGDEDPREK
jgi:hypothetical protein